MKVQLVFPKGGAKLSSTGVLPPLGIVALATYIKSRDSSIDVEIFDGHVESEESILSQLDGDIVGFSITSANYNNAFRMAREVKKRGCNVVFGGPETLAKMKEWIELPFVDAVVKKDGERVFFKYIEAYSKKCGFEEIYNLLYKKNGKILINRSYPKGQEEILDNLPVLDLSFLDKYKKKYEDNFKLHSYYKKGYTNFISLESQRGCGKTLTKKGRCSFCARVDLGLRRLSPQEFWKRVEALVDKNGKTMIWDISDSFTSNIGENWVEKVALVKPKELDGKVYFKIFARSDEITEDICDNLVKIGVKEVFIGVESGDQRVLDLANKGTTVEDNLKAVEFLTKFGIECYISLVYAMYGETKESLRNTYYHVKELVAKGNISGIGARLLFTLKGSTDGQRLIAKTREKGLELDWNNNNITDFWLKHCTYVSLNDVIKVHLAVMELCKKNKIKVNDIRRTLKTFK